MDEKNGQLDRLDKAAQRIGSTTEVERSRAVAETQAAMAIAKRWPRDPVLAMDRIMNACTRPALAEGALYEYSRGGSAISGPSIRLAEALAQAWGNIHYGIRELEQRDGVSTVEAFAWDIETNVRAIKVFHVPHVRSTRDGGYRLTDPRDIYELIANHGARRLRSCILAIIPGDVVEAAVAQCEQTLKTKADVTPERIAAMLEKFAEVGVSRAMIEARIQRRLEAMTPGQMLALGRIYNSLRDGMSTILDWFRVPGPESQQIGESAEEAQAAETGSAPEVDAGAPAQAVPAGSQEEVEGWQEFISTHELPQDGTLERFVALTADRNRMTLAEIQRAAVATPEKFLSAFASWQRAQRDKERLKRKEG